MDIFSPGWKKWPKFEGEMSNPVGMPDTSSPRGKLLTGAYLLEQHVHEIDSEKLSWKAVAMIYTILLSWYYNELMKRKRQVAWYLLVALNLKIFIFAW